MLGDKSARYMLLLVPVVVPAGNLLVPQNKEGYDVCLSYKTSNVSSACARVMVPGYALLLPLNLA